MPYNGDDWIAMRDKLKKSNILSFNEYLYDWCFLEDFTDQNTYKTKLVYPNISESDLIDGFPLFLQPTMQYNINALSRVNVIVYIFTVFIKEVKIFARNVLCT